MTSIPDLDLEARVAHIELALESITTRLDKLSQEKVHAPFPPTRRPQPVARPRPAAESSSNHQKPQSTESADFPSLEWFAARGAEWWIGSLGVLFLVIASFLLYRYAVDHEWITPLVRVLTGVIVGGGMFIAARHFTSRSAAPTDDAFGLREILLGGGIAVWYLTAYAAGIFYHLVSIQTARWLFLSLSIVSGWLALKERRLLLAALALGVGFAAPSLLLPIPFQSESVMSHVVYLAPLGALGLTLYLMRGWELVLWITFIGYWVTYPSLDVVRFSPSLSATVVSLLAIASAAAFVRTPILRRRLVEFNPDRYGTSSQAARVGLWIIPMATPMIALAILSFIWPRVGDEMWGALEVALAIGAYWFALNATESDATVKHVALTAAAIWSLAGVEWIALGLTTRIHFAYEPVAVGVAAIHAGVLIFLLKEKLFNIPRGFAKLTALAALFMILTFELGTPRLASFRWDWTIAEAVVLGLCAWLWLRLREEESPQMLASTTSPVSQPTAFAILGYGTLLLVLARVLGAVWLPLITASYATAGALLLVVSRQSSDRTLLLRLGAVTMLVVVGRLIIIDMSSVETIWRVLLFLACGAGFVGVSYRLQSAPVMQRPESAGG
ncbi:MAG: DUF2339 domain-containing protein [Gemmatimonadaceae bacterium]